MAKKTKKSLKKLTRAVDRLQRQNARIAATLEETREDQVKARREIQVLLEDRPEDSQRGQHDAQPEVTEPARRRAKELDVDLSSVEGTGSGGRILVKDVEDAGDITS